jgi:nucleotide-binding universal stress UspA family protein
VIRDVVEWKLMYTKILVPLDGSKLSEQILPYARLLAEAFQIPVELLLVNDPSAMTPYAPPLQDGDFLKQVAERSFSVPVKVSHSVEMGSPAKVIVDRASGDRDMMIAMATHGMSGIQRVILGSVAYKVAHTASNPLLLVRPVAQPEDPIRLKTLLVPLDGSNLADKILPHVVAVAQKVDLEVILLRAYTFPTETFLVGDGLYMEALSREREAIRKGIDDFLSAKSWELQSEGLNRISGLGVQGEPAHEIIDLARRTPNCLIAMSTHGRSGLERWVLGSVAEKVIHYSRDPVLMIRPGRAA